MWRAQEQDEIELRDVEPDDVGIFFVHQLDADARWMAASTSKDPADRGAFDAQWRRTLVDPSVVIRTIVAGGDPVGYVASFLRQGQREVAYWIGREHWGRGTTTAALQLFLEELHERPLHARVVRDNLGSLRVLEKCGFERMGQDRFFSHARGAMVEELVLVLPGVVAA